MTDNPLLERALYLLEAGFHIFPLGGHGEPPPAYFIERFKEKADPLAEATKQWPKTPRISWKQFQTAPPDEATVRHWWAMWPTANIGIATGKLIVVDADCADSVAWVKKNLTYTPWRVTTGKGAHFYYGCNPSLDVRNSADPLAKLDTRGPGGYVVAAGSRHHSGTYYADDIDADVGAAALCDLPTLQPSDIEAIKGFRHANMELASAAQPRQTTGNLVGFDASRYSTPATGEPVAEGGRNNALASLAGQYLAQNISLRDTVALARQWNDTNAAPLSDDELTTTVASVALTHQRNHPEQPICLISPEPATPQRKAKQTVMPVSLLNVPGLVGDVARYINKTSLKPQPILALGAALALCGTVMGRKVRGPTDIRTNAYVINVAASGAGKEHARSAIKRLLEECGAMNLIGAERLASDSGLFAALVAAPACLVMQDEIGRMLRTINDPRAPAFLAEIANSLMQLTGNANSTFMEKKRAEHIEKEIRTIYQPNLCLLGTTVPGRLFEAISAKDIEDGFLPRILIFHSENPDPDDQPMVDRTPEPELVDALRMWISRPINAYAAGNLESLKPNPLRVEHSPDADLVFAAYRLENRARKNATRGTGIDAMWARADEHALRLALIRAAGRDFDRPIVQIDDAQWACDLVTFLHTRTISEIEVKVADNQYESDLKRVLDYVAKRGAVSKSVLLREFRSINTKAMNDILGALQMSDEITVGLNKPTTGRAAMMVTWLNLSGK